MLLNVTEAQLATAKDSIQNLRDLVPRVKAEAYKNGQKKGRQGFGVGIGYDPARGEFSLTVGYTRILIPF
jgi:hypothetical protein